MQDKFTKILNLINTLDKAQLVSINKIIMTLIKQIESQERIKKSAEFRIGDLVYFKDHHQNQQEGMVLRTGNTSIQLMTIDSNKINVSPSILYVQLKPSKKLVNLKKIFEAPLGLIKK